MRFIRAAIGASWTLACLLSWAGAHAQGVTKTTILIGQSSPFSGSNKELGDDIREGLQAPSSVEPAGKFWPLRSLE